MYYNNFVLSDPGVNLWQQLTELQRRRCLLSHNHNRARHGHLRHYSVVVPELACCITWVWFLVSEVSKEWCILD